FESGHRHHVGASSVSLAPTFLLPHLYCCDIHRDPALSKESAGSFVRAKTYFAAHPPGGRFFMSCLRSTQGAEPAHLPNGQNAKPVPLRVMVHHDLGKADFGEENGKLRFVENSQTVNGRKPFFIAWTHP